MGDSLPRLLSGDKFYEKVVEYTERQKMEEREKKEKQGERDEKQKPRGRHVKIPKAVADIEKNKL